MPVEVVVVILQVIHQELLEQGALVVAAMGHQLELVVMQLLIPEAVAVEVLIIADIILVAMEAQV
jgi:hypothetical protein